MLIVIGTRVIAELGPWLWMIAGFASMTLEIISGRGIALSFALGAIVTGILAVFGASGVLPPTSTTLQSMIFAGSALAIFTATKHYTNRART